ncbi:hypothetical protein JOF29_003476 [Kribbella aluminosa]|uniref:Uncharacterized protein n=1 Tax=Kribbella aluminosa TaxID=416017 RepID=A0ABS4UL74_9ACTN|nr:hypothetical protein [Kribbella aluminosa]MBP2352393.1 hypothetical protein [Kribbella aluminosa]
MGSDTNSWSMSFPSRPPAGQFKLPDIAVMTVRSTGAIRFAPRTLRCWIARDQIAVRSSTGELIWVEDTTAPTSNPDEEVAWVSPKAPEAPALRDLSSLCAWLGLHPSAVTRTSTTDQFLGRAVHRYDAHDLQDSRFTPVSITEDDESGAILKISATSISRGPLQLEASTFDLVPWSADYFTPTSPI